MSARNRIRLDHAGIGEVLKSDEVREAIDALADSVADSVRSSPTVTKRGIADRVEVSSYTTDRAAAAVAIAHAAGLGMEAKHGVVTQAAGQAGLEVRSRE